MILFFKLLPVYLFGNLHCAGMCGPLVSTIGMNRYRYFYILGRVVSYTMTGMLAGGFGSVIALGLNEFHISALLSFLLGGLLIYAGCCQIKKKEIGAVHLLAKKFQPYQQKLISLILQDHPLKTFAFGFFTIGLPCGQTILVFSACALSGSFFEGTLNGFLFAVFTSPSLIFAMGAKKIAKHFKDPSKLMGTAILFIGVLSVCRALADLNFISHLILNPEWDNRFHIVVY